MQALIGGKIQSAVLAAGEPGDRLFGVEEEPAAELVAAGHLAFAGAFVDPALPRLLGLRGWELGDELVEAEQPPRRRRGRGGLVGKFGGQVGHEGGGQEFGELVEQLLERGAGQG